MSSSVQMATETSFNLLLNCLLYFFIDPKRHLGSYMTPELQTTAVGQDIQYMYDPIWI